MSIRKYDPAGIPPEKVPAVIPNVPTNGVAALAAAVAAPPTTPTVTRATRVRPLATAPALSHNFDLIIWSISLSCRGRGRPLRRGFLARVGSGPCRSAGPLRRRRRAGPRGDVVARLADLLGNHAGPHQQSEDLAPETDPEGRLEEGGHDQEPERDVGRAPQPETEGQDGGRHREDDADPLGEALRGSGHGPRFPPEQRGHDPDRELAQGTQGGAGEHAGHEAVGEHDGQPRLVEGDGERGEDDDPGGHDPRRDLVDGIRKGEEPPGRARLGGAVDAMGGGCHGRRPFRSCHEALTVLWKVPCRCQTPTKLLNGPPWTWLVHVRV